LLQFRLADPGATLHGQEPIWRDGHLVGVTTAGAFGYRLNASLAMGYVDLPDGADEQALLGGTYEIELACRNIPASASLRGFYTSRASQPEHDRVPGVPGRSSHPVTAVP
jgi:4-methylaminobutanoate oxidase (formaldehyde-forming)